METYAIYNIRGEDIEGKKDVLVLYISGNEGSKFWLSVFTDLKARGVKAIFIACSDGLKGFPEAVKTVFPKTKVQLCIVHQIRSSMRYVPNKDKKVVRADLRQIY